MACCGKSGSSRRAVAPTGVAASAALPQLTETRNTIQVRYTGNFPANSVAGSPSGAVYRPTSNVLSVYKRDLAHILSLPGFSQE